MRGAIVIACLVFFVPAATAQTHAIVALSHSDHTAYEIDPASGKILNQFTAVDQPHEGVRLPTARRSTRPSRTARTW